MEDDQLNEFDFKKKDEKYVNITAKDLEGADEISVDLDETAELPNKLLSSNSRCVSVDTILSAPEGRRKKEMFKGKADFVKFRCTVYEKKLIRIKAKRSGLSLSEYIRRCVFEMEIVERFSEEHITIYKMLIKYHNNFKSIGNMFTKRDPKLKQQVIELAEAIKQHLKAFKT